MKEPRFGLHPEGQAGRWVFRLVVPGIGQINRGEVTVSTTLADEELPMELQKATALEKINLIAQALAEASSRAPDAETREASEPGGD